MSLRITYSIQPHPIAILKKERKKERKRAWGTAQWSVLHSSIWWFGEEHPFFKMLIGFGHVYVWVFCLHVCICTMCKLNALRGQRSDPLEVELQVDGNHLGGAFTS